MKLGLIATLFTTALGRLVLTHSEIGAHRPLHTTMHSQFYEVSSRRVDTVPVLTDLVQHVLERDELVFTVGRREFALRPLECVKVNGRTGTSKILGRFERMSTSHSQLVLVFSDGGTGHECIVKISAGEEPPGINECRYKTVLYLKLRDALQSETERAIVVVSSRPTVGSRLADLSKQGIECTNK
ncbi:uncharacterized protein VICG_02103 [Vittaforma corneae ATCC 50505]|uniref:Secreted protein n=1 Tax=Vittaforma corneae (strain ATCC 50505) TaxID=993615 RepID=L2GKP0_VITCO|nr:uncharacterized protein VICG_02103 [Vittaforma corneae ATCC 50505]ELA40862.1 hypothetical protein VICG_02103 [Vittaforma corneae ATCC 50505]